MYVSRSPLAQPLVPSFHHWKSLRQPEVKESTEPNIEKKVCMSVYRSRVKIEPARRWVMQDALGALACAAMH